MFKKSLLVGLSLCAVLLSGSFAAKPAAAAAAQPVTVEAPVLLKINQYYILYTDPAAPYIDKQNRFMIPLRSISELMGAKVSYNASTKVGKIELDGKTAEVTLNSKTVTYNGTETQLDTVPVLKSSQMFVPMRVVLDGLGVKGDWNPADQLLTVKDEKFKTSSKLIGYMEDGTDRYNTPKGIDIDTNEIRPLSYKLTLPGAVNKADSARITIKAQNISGKDLAAGEEDLRPTFFTAKSYQFTNNQSSKTPAVKAGATFERTFNIIVGGGDEGQLTYIVAVGKTKG